MAMSVSHSESQQEKRRSAPPRDQRYAHFLDPSGSLATRQVNEMVAAWRRGERPLAEDFLARHPELSDDAAIRLIYEEVCLRHEAGLPVDPKEIAGRFPRWREELEVLLHIQQRMESKSSPTAPAFPCEGESLAGFRLVLELGRGAAGRVFLAVQPSLADRPVVLKVAPRGREEHLALARLQHMNIVPIYSEHVLLARDLRIICMPFLGGATLGQVLELVSKAPPGRRSGRMLIDALDQIQAGRPIAAATGGPLRQFIAICSYIESICLIGASLADGLQYAHDRNLLHMDLKPSNVLIAADGQPMLLDFHLAQKPLNSGDPPPVWAGGTPGYMSPEQWEVVTAVRQGRPVSRSVDRRSDIYSLGALLYEALGGKLAELPGAVLPPVCQFDSRVSTGLSDILLKCLCDRPADRYRDATALANDLRRHLNNLPLKGVANRSFPERWRKWRRRRPGALSRAIVSMVLAASVFLTIGSVGLSFRQRTREADSALAQGRAFLERNRFAEARDALNRGLALVERVPGSAGRRAALVRELVLANRGVKLDELHQLADLIRFRYGVALPPFEEAQSLIQLGRAIWQRRNDLTRPRAQRDEAAVDDRTRTDLIDLMVLWTELRGRYASKTEAVEAKWEALRFLEEAEALLGNSAALARQRWAFASALGVEKSARSAEVNARSAWEHFDLGKSYLRSGDATRALKEFQIGVALSPQDFWLNFYEGLCAYRLERFEDALAAFRAAISLSPRSAECYYNRGLAYQALGRLNLALADYDRALELNTDFADAALNRGVVRYRLGHHAAAREDLKRALLSSPDRKVRGIIHYNLALIDLSLGDRKSCEANVQRALEFGNRDAEALSERLRR
jgi:serine/threonine protein kinase/tetratricopeptide (TPR) repeat protein